MSQSASFIKVWLAAAGKNISRLSSDLMFEADLKAPMFVFLYSFFINEIPF